MPCFNRPSQDARVWPVALIATPVPTTTTTCGRDLSSSLAICIRSGERSGVIMLKLICPPLSEGQIADGEPREVRSKSFDCRILDWRAVRHWKFVIRTSDHGRLVRCSWTQRRWGRVGLPRPQAGQVPAKSECVTLCLVPDCAFEIDGGQCNWSSCPRRCGGGRWRWFRLVLALRGASRNDGTPCLRRVHAPFCSDL